MTRIILISVSILLTCQLIAQDLRTSRQSSYYTFIYKLTETQAAHIYKKNIHHVDDTYFKQLIDSFPTSGKYQKPLPTGHYLYVNTLRNKLELELISENNVLINVLNNSRDLNIVVYDTTGRMITNAEVEIKHKPISYNTLTQTYLLPYTNKDGLLIVNYQGHTNYFALNEKYNYSKCKKILFRSPLKIIAIPVTLVVNIPYDTYRLFRQLRPFGIYYYIWKPIGDPVESIRAGAPQGYIRTLTKIIGHDYSNCKGYLVFNKPKYHPGDTVYFKAYIVDGNNKPVKDSLQVETFSDKNIKLGWVKPYKPGAFKFQFILNKSLGLKLDRNYSIYLRKRRKNCISNHFRFEEYELKSTNYEFRASKTEYHYNDPVTFYCKGTDENDLSLPDARINLILLRKDIKEYYKSRVYVKDTLWVHKQNLDPLGETKIIVPDSIFPEVAVKVTVEATFLNSNNELEKRTVNFVKDNRKKEIVFNLNGDSLDISFLYEGKPQIKEAVLNIAGFVKNKKIQLPYKDKINPFANSYNVIANSVYNSFIIADQSSNVQCYSSRDADSVWFSIDNPRKLPLTYTIFRKNKPIFRGNSENLKFKCKSTTYKNYSASVQYIWGDEAKSDEYIIPFYDKKLNIRIFEPSVVYPGQKTTINMAVTDAFGKPVANADITGFSYTKKFKESNETLVPYLGKNYPNRTCFNSYKKDDDFEQLDGNKLLNYKTWNRLFRLDSIEFYKFLYPKNGYYEYVIKRTDSTFAEVSPFLVDSTGNPLPINILYIDGNPVYYSITTNNKPYVFRTTEGWHSLVIRTNQFEINVKKIYLKKKTKTILCINPYILNSKYFISKKQNYYSAYEKNLIKNSVFAIRNNHFNNNFSFLQQNNNLEILNPNGYYFNQLIVGPYIRNTFTYTVPSYFDISTDYEPGYSYEFNPKLVKMRTWDLGLNKKQYVDNKKPTESFNDSAYTLQDINYLWDQLVKNKQLNKLVLNNPNYTNTGNGTLLIDYKPDTVKTDLQAKILILFAYLDTTNIEVFAGNTNTMYDLRSGYYRLEIILFNNQSIIVDSINIKPNGINYCRFSALKRQQNNRNIEKINQIIQKREEFVVIANAARNTGSLSLRKREISSAMQRISLGALEGVQVLSLDEALQGRVAGMDITCSSGDISMRGASGIKTIDEAMFGPRAANGILLINTKRKNGNDLVKSMLQNKEFMDGVNQSKSLRNRFSDYAFWKPDLTTNDKGIASFEVTFPDDITSWKTFYYAMGENKTSGKTEGEIKSFKPIASSLALPRFLVSGDKCNIIGKALNYTNDSIQVKTTFDINDSTTYCKNGKILSARIDTFPLVVTNTDDSIKIKYQLTKDDNYTDGEQRYIPVFPLGTLETKGNFYNLDSDTTITLTFDKSLGQVTLHAEADIINILLEEMKRLRNYHHLCNEQLSSKLKGMLMERDIFKRMNKKYSFDKDIRNIINLLEQRRNADSLWGWWQNGATSWWITMHATEALKKAENAGFKTNMDFSLLAPIIHTQYHTMHNRDQIRAVKLLKAIDTVPNYQSLADSIKISKYDTVGRYELWELKQTCGLQFPLENLKREQKITQFGNYYWGTECYSLFDDAISATLVAYRILHKTNPQNRELHKIRNYLLERKGNLHWHNTWETSRILETILPDLISNNELNLKPQLRISGELNEIVDSFPYTKKIEPGKPIYITKRSNAPVYLTTSQEFFNSKPLAITKDFIVTSRFENNDSILQAGKPIKLIVNVSVKKASEYVMIEIPIPAGCSYQDKNNFIRGEDYREYFKEKVSIYCSRLGQNNYTFEVNLLPRYNGTYHLNPAKAELMYFPVFYGREKMKQIVIE